MEKILITGGAGFIGSHLTNYFTGKNYEVIVIDDLSHASKQIRNRKSKFIRLDLRSKDLKKVIINEKPDVVYHLAAQSSISKSRIDPISDIDINLIGTLNLIESVKNSRVKKVIFASSAAVYARNVDRPTKENATREPFTMYGISKLNSELLLSIYSKLYGILTITLRFSNVYGEYQDSGGESGVIAIFSRRITEGKKLTIFDNGKQTRDFVYVQDVVNACYRAMSINSNGHFNVSTARETTISDLAQLLQTIAGTKLPVTYKIRNFIEAEKSSLSNAKLYQECGWEPKTDLMAGLKKTFNYLASRK